jgi:hypothetical protein
MQLTESQPHTIFLTMLGHIFSNVFKMNGQIDDVNTQCMYVPV